LKEADSPSHNKESPYISAFKKTLGENGDEEVPKRVGSKNVSAEKGTTPKDISTLDPKQLDIN